MYFANENIRIGTLVGTGQKAPEYIKQICHQMVSLIDPLPQLKAWLPKIFHLHGKDATIH